MKLKLIQLLALLVIVVSGLQFRVTVAQTPTPVQLPPPNALLIYDKTTVALINSSTARISLTGLTFMRAGGVVKFNATTMGTFLDPGHCFQVWVSDVRQVIGKPDECMIRDRWQRLTRKENYFWAGDYEREPFRPQLSNSALTICNAAISKIERCAFNIPQGDEAQKPWNVLDTASGLPMPAGLQVAYDANQMWIGNFTPETVLPTKTLRLLYTINGKSTTWTPGSSAWDIGQWDGRGLLAGQCIALYADATQFGPLLPCTLIARAVLADQPWRVKFDVMGPREERRTTCGSDAPAGGPVLCLLPG